MQPGPHVEQFERFVQLHRWTFARTMPWVPHEWTLIGRSPDPRLFRLGVQIIHDHGTPRRWKKTPVRRYLDLGEWRYWYMNVDYEAVTLVNRAHPIHENYTDA